MAVAGKSPVVKGALAAVQVAAPSTLRQAVRPAVQRRRWLPGSMTKGVMKPKLSELSVTPVVAPLNVPPPSVDLRMERRVVSANSTFVSAGSTATYPPSPPQICDQALG